VAAAGLRRLLLGVVGGAGTASVGSLVLVVVALLVLDFLMGAAGLAGALRLVGLDGAGVSFVLSACISAVAVAV